MDQRDFDALTRALVEASHGRRGLLRTLLAGLGAALAAHGPGAAANKRQTKTKRRRGKDAADRDRRSRAKRRGRLGAQAGGEDQPPYCTPGGQYCDVSSECCNDLCCGNECCVKSPNVVCCPNPQGKEFCTNLKTSDGHCGKCGNKCPLGSECKDGKCIDVTCGCPLNQVCKDGTCIVDPQCAVQNGCPGDSFSGESTCCGEQCCPGFSTCCGGACCAYPRDCIDGRCVCPREQHCGDVCCDTNETCCQGVCISEYGVNRDHCGACGNACGPDEACCDVTGELEEQRCLTPPECCAARARQTGKAWNICGDGFGLDACCSDETICCGGECIVPPDLCCDGQWAAPWDRATCGACGSVCKPNELCCRIGWDQQTGYVFECRDHAACCEILSKLDDEKYVPCRTGDDRECCVAA